MSKGMSGYPTEEELTTLEEWDTIKDLDGLIEYILEVWHWDDYAEHYKTKNGHTILELHTGGWSGNEELIGALQSNTMFWLLYFWIHRTGGHYFFNITRRIIDGWPDKLHRNKEKS